MRPQPKIAIVGGSLVGPAAELFLRREGFTDVTTYEALPHPHSQSGGVMGVRFTTLDLLDLVGITRAQIMALDDPDVYAFDVRPGGHGVDLRGKSRFPGQVTSWDALHAEEADRADVQYGHTIKARRTEHGREVLTCSCGREHDADIVIWADGRKSLGRTLLDPARTLQYNGYVVWRGLAEPPTPTPHGFHRYYDIAGGRLFSITQPVIQSGLSYWEFSHNLPASEWMFLAGDAPERHAFMLPGWVKRHPEVRTTIAAHAEGLPHRLTDMIDHSEVSGIPVNDVPLPGRMIHHHSGGSMNVLMGDAIVPVRLQVGAGLNQGLHQAYDFARALTATSRDAALHTFETDALATLGRMVEQGRSRAHRNNLGWYVPVKPGITTAPEDDQWTEPKWVIA